MATLLEQVADDSATFFDQSVGFGEPATFRRQGAGQSYPLSVSFEDAYHEQDAGARVESRRKQIAFQSSEWPDIREGDTVTVRGGTYYVQDPQPDGLGVTTATLSPDVQ